MIAVAAFDDELTVELAELLLAAAVVAVVVVETVIVVSMMVVVVAAVAAAAVDVAAAAAVVIAAVAPEFFDVLLDLEGAVNEVENWLCAYLDFLVMH